MNPAATHRQELEFHAFSETLALCQEVAARFNEPARLIRVHRFPDGESLVRVESRGPSRAVVMRSLDDPNSKLVELLFAADALRRHGVDELILVAPYLAYMRQDRAFREGEAVSQQVVAAALGAAFDRVITVDAHLHRIARLAEVFPCEARSVSAADTLGEWCEKAGHDLVVGPDEESLSLARAVAERAGRPFVVCSKSRSGDREVKVSLPSLHTPTRSALIVDDIGSSGVTLEAVAHALRAAGVEVIDAAVVHALFREDALDRLRDAGVASLVSSDSVAHPTNRISLAPLLADALRQPLGAEG